MRRIPVADGRGERQARQADFVPEPPRDVLSSEAHEYVDGVQPAQQAAARNPILNGEDALARLRGPHGG
jgi:hypothetical protein